MRGPKRQRTRPREGSGSVGRAGGSSAEQGGCQAAPLRLGHRHTVLQHLHTDVVGAGRVVLGDAGGDLVLGAPGDDRVDQAVAAAVGAVVSR